MLKISPSKFSRKAQPPTAGRGREASDSSRTAVLVFALLCGSRIAAVGAEYAAPVREPVYIGAAACTKCHTGIEMGHQFSLWRLSAHARAFASLSLPEAKEIAALSGITREPQESRLCLGCHATAADVEPWERDPGFSLSDGLQCEKCHGPGSEYAFRNIMQDREAAIAHGLRIPTRESCRMCHREKGSHQAVLDDPPFDLEKAWQTIAHPVPKNWIPPEPASSSTAAPSPPPASYRFTGARACGECHRGPEMGFQLSQWRLGPHARAYADLAGPRGYEIARQEGVKGDPQENPQCLACHTTGAGYEPRTFLDTFEFRDGVQCESCHGPGSDYSPEDIMRDHDAARRAGLREIGPATCAGCHAEAHGKPFDFETAVARIAHPKELPVSTEQPHYKTPLNLAMTPDQRELWVACEAGDAVMVVDPSSGRILAEIPVGGQATDVAFDPAGRRAFVSNRLDDTVAVLNVGTREIMEVLPVGDEPHGVLVDREGRYLYVLNTSSDSISVIDLATLREVKRLTASRSPWSLALSPDGRLIYVTNTLSRFVSERTPSMSEVTVIDTEKVMVVDRIVVPGANLLQGIAWHPSGEFAVITLNRTKNLVPMTRLLQGWTITNGIGILWRDGRVDQVLLDQPNLCFPDPADVTITPDGRRALVTSSGSNRVAIVDLDKLTVMLKSASGEERDRIFPNHLGLPTEFTVEFVETETSPRGITCTDDGRVAYVANALDDSLTAIDLAGGVTARRIDLGGPEEITEVRWGEQLFHSADITFRRQFSCHTCHPDGHIDGITYDIEPDGIGVSPVDNRTLRGILDMAPFKWEGTNPTLQRQCGPRLAVFFTRIDPFTPKELAALEHYICTIPRPPNRYRKLGAPLTPAQRRGKKLFERGWSNDGKPIPEQKRCTTCHPPPLYTDGNRHDIGTKMPLDRTGRFDAPHLNNIYDSAPYLHNGMAQTLEEIWTRYNPNDQHGVTNDLTKDQLNDLIEYLKTL